MHCTSHNTLSIMCMCTYFARMNRSKKIKVKSNNDQINNCQLNHQPQDKTMMSCLFCEYRGVGRMAVANCSYVCVGGSTRLYG